MWTSERRRIHARTMRQRRLSSLLPCSGAAFPASELSLLAREARRRQHLARSTQPTRLQALTPPEAVPARQVAPSATAIPAEDLGEVQPARPGASSPQNHAPSLQLLGRRQPAAKERNKARYGGRDARRRKRRSSDSGATRKSISSNHPPPSAKDYNQHTGDDPALDPGVEAAMLRVFSGDGRDGGVSVSAIRRLYRKRHEEEKARALEEVRRWWRVGGSEAVPLAEATVAASLMLASRDGGAQNNHDGPTAVDLAENGTVPQELELTDDAMHVVGGVFSSADGSHGSPSTRENGHRDQAHLYRIIDDLDWRQVFQDPSYAASVVRDVKQALRAGKSVKIRSRQEPLIGRRISADSQLVLRTLYMQCVRCCEDPALPPIEHDGTSVSMLLEPARRYRRPDSATTGAIAIGDASGTVAWQDALPVLPFSLRGSSC